MDQFWLYGAHKSITLTELLEQQRSHQMLFARAEQSGCEGTYVEVAIWNENHRQWQRYAFLKCFGGEHPELPDAGSIETATRYARDINAIAHVNDVQWSIVHTLPCYTGECPAVPGASGSPLLEFAKEMVGYLGMKLDQFRMTYPEDHAIVTTCSNYLKQAQDLVWGQQDHDTRPN